MRRIEIDIIFFFLPVHDIIAVIIVILNYLFISSLGGEFHSIEKIFPSLEQTGPLLVLVYFFLIELASDWRGI